MQPYTICLTGGVARNPLVRLAAPASASFPADEHIAIVGPNGSGKSLLVDMLIGKYPLKEGTITYDFLLQRQKQSMRISNILLFAIRMVRRMPTIIISSAGILMIMMMFR